ncbi:hypothetical protein TrRE_jg8646 [Triparma retinervis]|uniref:Uncharacterized protein n=1 Tax=Triparma retinervis TaxID=2557542 RepID=A0A9W6ZZ52_9STRA|nr:hypothetical protein TrRE_jg8646 [Triparma retinervis]
MDSFSSFPFQSPSTSTIVAPDISSVTAVDSPSVSHSSKVLSLASDLQVNIGALEVLHGLARRSSYTKTTPVAVKQAGNLGYDGDGEAVVEHLETAVANNWGGEQGGGVGEIMARLRGDLRTTQEDLVRAVKGWKKDRSDYEKKLEEVRRESNVGQVKARYMEEKKKLRGQIAALQARVREAEGKYSRTCMEYESKLQGLGSSVLDARLQREKDRASIRRKSLAMSTSVNDSLLSASSLSRECQSLRRENSDLRNALREAEVEIQNSRIGGRNQGEEDKRRVTELERENGRLKAQLENRVKKPGRRPPAPPVTVDFGKFSGVGGLDDLLEPDL